MLLPLALAGCAPSVPPVRAPVAPSTHRDPPPYVPAPDAAPTTGALVGVIVSGGEDQARALLVRLVLAIRDADADAVGEVLAPSVLLPGRSRRIEGARLAAQWVSQARTAGLPPDAPFEELVDVESIRVGPIPAQPAVSDLLPGDLLVRFALTPLARRALAGVAPGDGQGALVVRPGEDPRVVAR